MRVTPTRQIRLTCPSLNDDGTLPKTYTREGENISPALRWDGIPDGTREFALIVEDPDAPTEQPFVHWLLYKIPGDLTELPQDLARKPDLDSPDGMLQGVNDFGLSGYGGPAPPEGDGIHRYHFRLYALDTKLDLMPGLDKMRLTQAMDGHILSMGEVVGTYQR